MSFGIIEYSQELREALLKPMTILRGKVSPKKYDCGHYSTDRYYYEEKETDKTICSDCWKKQQLEKASKVNKEMSSAFFKMTKKIR